MAIRVERKQRVGGGNFSWLSFSAVLGLLWFFGSHASAVNLDEVKQLFDGMTPAQRQAVFAQTGDSPQDLWKFFSTLDVDQRQDLLGTQATSADALRRRFLSMSFQDKMKLLKKLKSLQKGRAEGFEEPELVKPRDVDGVESAMGEYLLADGNEDEDEDEDEDADEDADADADAEVLGRWESLKPFGYHLFAGAPTTFAPATDIPVPSTYVVGPGDTVEILLFGKKSDQYQLVVGRDGKINFPPIGPVAVSGMSFAQMVKRIEDRVRNQMIGVRASITMGGLRSIRIFALGDVYRPGSYTVSALSTLTNALFVSGGIDTIGSLRRVQLKRRGRLVGTLDLYKLLLEGDTSGDLRLRPGDVLFVPPVGSRISVGGEVKRPALYELNREKSIGDVLKMAGGLQATSLAGRAVLERVNQNDERTLIDIDLRKPEELETPVQDGDRLQVFSVLDRLEGAVMVEGHVQRPRPVQWREGLRLLDVLPTADEFLEEADLHYLLLSRRAEGTRRLQAVSADWLAAFSDAQSAANIELRPQDVVHVFGPGEERAEYLASVQEKLDKQRRLDEPPLVIHVAGDVHAPGSYPWEPAMGLKRAVWAAAGVKAEADLSYALVLREESTGRLEARSVRLKDSADGAASGSGLRLGKNDQILIFSRNGDRLELLMPHLERLFKEATRAEPARVVQVDGSVRFAGVYPLEKGMRVADLIRASGGLEEGAYTLGAEVTRFEIREGRQRLTSHVPVELEAALAGDSEANILLEPHDFVTIKRIADWTTDATVSLGGELVFPGRYPIEKGETLRELVERAGGTTEEAFLRGAVFVRAGLREKERKRFEEMAKRLELDLANRRVIDEESASSAGAEEALLKSLTEKVKGMEGQGRLVVDLESVLSGQAEDIVLLDGDELFIPKPPQEVTVIGEVFRPTSHLHQGETRIEDYINLSGGFTAKADSGRIYVVRADGSVWSTSGGSSWFRRMSMEVKAGDTVVVPLDVDSLSSISMWSDISQIVYQLAVSAASIKTLGLF